MRARAARFLRPAPFIALAALPLLLLTSACERPFVAEVPPSIDVAAPDLNVVQLNPTVPVEIRAASFRPVVRVEINGDTLTYDAANDVWRDTLHLQVGLNTVVIDAYDDQGIRSLDTTYAVYLPLTLSPDAPALPEPRGGHAATRLEGGGLLITGGAAAADGPARSEAFLLPNGAAEFEVLDGELQAARGGHTATLLPDGRVLIVGGMRSDAPSGEGFIEAVELYDPATRRFETIPVRGDPIRRARHTAAVHETGGDVTVYLYGGLVPNSASPSGVGPSETLRTFVLRNDTLINQGPFGLFLLDDALAGHTQTPLAPFAADGPTRYLVAGTHFALNREWTGSFVLEVGGPRGIDTYETRTLTTPRTRHAAAPILPGVVLLHGGVGPSEAAAPASMEVFFADVNRYFRIPDAVNPAKRFGHTATILPSQRILVAGGFAPGGDGIAASAYIELKSD